MDITLRSVARDDASAERWHTEVRKTDRPEIGSSDLAKLVLRATAPLMSKFVPLTLSMEDENQLENAYNVSLRLDELKTTLLRFDMLDVFTILFPTDPKSSKDNSITKKISLFDNFSSVTVEEVCASNRHYRRYGEEYHLQNLDWTLQLLLRSCDDELRNRVLEKTMSVKPIEAGGPLFLIVMLKEITTVSQDSIRALTSKITGFKISDVPGENVRKAVSQLHGAITRLTVVNQVPHDLPDKLLEVFATSSVPEFNEIFLQMARAKKYSSVKFEVKKILEVAEDAYFELLTRDAWNKAKNTPNAVFISKNTQDVTCYKCGAVGHKANICPLRKAGGKWAPPKDNETNEKEIDGKPYHWNEDNRRWYKIKPNEHQANTSLKNNALTEDRTQDHDAQTTSHSRANFSQLMGTSSALAAAMARSQDS